MVKDLILHNDNVHDYDYVRACLIRYCEHSFAQAEQCIIIAHNNGKAHIKKADVIDAIVIKDNLESKNLKIEMQESCHYQ